MQRQQQSSDLLEDLEYMDPFELKSLLSVEMKSMFGDLVEDEDALALWAPFCDCTEQQQDELLAAIVEARKKKKGNDPHGVDVSTMFKRIDGRIRALFKKRSMLDCPFVEELEDQIEEMLSQHSTQLCLEMESSYHRLLARGVAQYYGLRFESKEEAAVHTVTISVKETQEYPPTRLMAYVSELGAAQRVAEGAAEEPTNKRKTRRSAGKSKSDLSLRLTALKVR